ARHRPDHGLLQHAEWRRAAVQAARRSIHDERQLPSAGYGGGTGPDSVPLGFADQVFFGDGAGNAVAPPATSIYNPNAVVSAYSAGNFNLYTLRRQWFNCSDPAQPGVQPILSYLQSLPYEVSSNCDPGHFYNAVNVNPAWTPQGTPQTGTIVPA